AFLKARQALKNGEMGTFYTLSHRLKHYALYPYLRYDYLRTRLDATPDGVLLEFIKRYADSPVSERLHRAWLHTLARERRWHMFLHVYRSSRDPALQCYALRAHIHTGHAAGLWDQVEPLWRVGHAQPKACEPLFNRFYASRRITPDLLWQRIRLAMDAGHSRLAGELAQHLDRRGRDQARLWQRVYRHPQRALASPRLRHDGPITRDIVLSGIRRLARRDADTAHDLWQTLRPRYRFTPAQIDHAQRVIALAAAHQQSPAAMRRLAAAPADTQIKLWRVRTALAGRQWDAVLAGIQDLPAALRDGDQWRYWRARALGKLGNNAAATAIYRTLAEARSYYGFLSADRVGQPYHMDDQPLDHGEERLARLLDLPGMARARELYRVGLAHDARDEWRYATRTMNAQQLGSAAVLAYRWGWYDQAILTAARSGDFDDLRLRFPTPYRRLVMANARQLGLSPSWIYGLLRQESLFRADARSGVGALGLMQIMPRTGAYTARNIGVFLGHMDELLVPANNIRLGCAYLDHLLAMFGGNQVLATAAYNAGPRRVKRWLPVQDAVPADVWIDTLPYTETRRYVRAVLAYSVVFNRRLDHKPLSLSALMPPIGPGQIMRAAGFKRPARTAALVDPAGDHF
ncbi:MAG: transglycosylase SLT domain-containing protein, partial [Gammaproteobacteria bacterium]|nr:transglycosylase SLT domain-containing protein [Gammaproteobacteria bacterium]